MNGSDRTPAQLLAEPALFTGLDHDELADLVHPSNVVDVPAGAVLIRCGDEGDCAYLVLAGRLQATIPTGTDPDERGTVVGHVQRGELAGEMALLTEEPRGATVIAVRDTQVLRIEWDALSRIWPSGCEDAASAGAEHRGGPIRAAS